MPTGYIKLALLRLMYQNEIIEASPRIELYNGTTLVKTYTSPSCTRTNLPNGVRIACSVEDTSEDELEFDYVYLKRTEWAFREDTIAEFHYAAKWSKNADQKLTIVIALDLTASQYY